MEQIIRMLVQIFLMFLAVVALHGKALGDIAPPPPDIPGTEIVLPEPGVVLIGGLLFAAAIAWSGSIASRKGHSSRGRIGKAAAAVVACLAVAISVFAFVEYQNYSDVRANYRSPGPVKKVVADEADGTESIAAAGAEESSS